MIDERLAIWASGACRRWAAPGMFLSPASSLAAEEETKNSCKGKLYYFYDRRSNIWFREREYAQEC
jgi:hypothetical protein